MTNPPTPVDSDAKRRGRIGRAGVVHEHGHLAFFKHNLRRAFRTVEHDDDLVESCADRRLDEDGHIERVGGLGEIIPLGPTASARRFLDGDDDRSDAHVSERTGMTRDTW